MGMALNSKLWVQSFVQVAGTQQKVQAWRSQVRVDQKVVWGVCKCSLRKVSVQGRNHRSGTGSRWRQSWQGILHSDCHFLEAWRQWQDGTWNCKWNGIGIQTLNSRANCTSLVETRACQHVLEVKHRPPTECRNAITYYGMRLERIPQLAPGDLNSASKDHHQKTQVTQQRVDFRLPSQKLCFWVL